MATLNYTHTTLNYIHTTLHYIHVSTCMDPTHVDTMFERGIYCTSTHSRDSCTYTVGSILRQGLFHTDRSANYIGADMVVLLVLVLFAFQPLQVSAQG